MKRIASVILLLAMLLLSVPGTTVFAEDTAQTSPTQVAIADDATEVTLDGKTYRVIRTPEALAAATAAGNYILAGNIDGGNTTVSEPILTLASGSILNGNGYRISGYRVETSGKSGALFAFGAGADPITVCNLTIGDESAPIMLKSDQPIGLFAEDASDTVAEWKNNRFYVSAEVSENANLGMLIPNLRGKHTLSDCRMTATIQHTGANSVGLWFGQQYSTSTLTMTDCASYGSIVTKGQAGGLVGNMQGSANVTRFVNRATMTTTGGNASGLVAYATLNEGVTRSFTDCVNYAAISAVVEGANNNQGIVAGIYAYAIAGNPTVSVSFKGCVNYGTLNGTPTIYRGIGGIYGMESTKSPNLTLSFENCTNYGDIVGSETRIGGILGGTVAGATLKNCFNYGSVTGKSGKYGRIGGIVGSFYSLPITLEGCVNYGTVSSANNAGGMIGHAEIDATLTDCVNYGKISGVTNNAGGMIALFAGVGTLTHCANYGVIQDGTAGGLIGSGSKALTAVNCLNAGSVSGTSHTGGLVGYYSAACTLENCANIGILSNTGSNIGNVGGVIKAEGSVLKTVYCFGTISSANKEKAGVVLGSDSVAPATSENVRYLAVADCGSTVGLDGANAISAEETPALLGTMLSGKTFIISEDGIPVDATPVLRAVQNTAVTDGVYRVRFLAVLQTLQYEAVGFDLSYTYTDANGKQQKALKKNCEYVMTAVTAAEEDGNAKAVTATELFGKFLFALTVNDIPEAVGDVVFTITPYAKGLDVTYTGQTMRVTYRSGAFVSYEIAE